MTTLDDHGNTPATATALTTASTVFTLDSTTDADVFKVALKANVSYAFTVDAAASDVKLTVLAASGKELSYPGTWGPTYPDDAGVGGNATVMQRLFTPAASGDYFIKASAVQDVGAGPHMLRWQATTEHDDYAAGTATPGRLDMYGVVTGVIDKPGQSDWVRIDLKGGTDYVFTMLAADSSNYTLGSGTADAQLALYDGSGIRLKMTAGGGAGGDPRLAYKPAADGTFYLAASEATGKGTGSYAILADGNGAGPADDFSAGRDTAGIMTVGSAKTLQNEPWGGDPELHVTASDTDCLRVYLKAGTRYEFSAAQGTLKTLPSIALSDNLGREIKFASGLATKKLYYTPGESGYYLLRGYGGSEKGSYTVKAQVYGVADDAGDDTGTQATLAPGASRLGVLDVAGDADWFKVEMTAGNRYDITLESSNPVSDSGWPYPDLWMTLSDVAGFDVGNNQWERNPVDKISVTPAVTGTYYLKVYGDLDSRGNYKVSMAKTDLTPPPVPVIKTAPNVVSNHLELTGTAEAGAQVAIEVDGARIGSATADSAGNWFFGTVAGRLAAGAHTAVAYAIDDGRNASAGTVALPFSIDLTAPPAPTVSVKRAADGAMQAGGAAQPGAKVTLTALSGTGTAIALGQAIAGADGKWQLAVRAGALPDGAYDMKAVATSAAGNDSADTMLRGVAVYEHQLPLPVLDALSELPATLMREAVSLSGTAQPQSTVQVLDGGKLVASALATGGRWALDLKLADGAHTLALRSMDTLGNLSGTVKFDVTVDTHAPAAPAWSADAVNGKSANNQLLLTGHAETGSVVRVHDGARLLGEVTAGANGAWQLKTPVLADGMHVISAVARDAAGWESPRAEQGIAVQSPQNITGTAGADSIVLTPGSHAIDGGAGTDTLVVPGTRAAAGAKAGPEGVTLVWQNGASVLLQNVERVVFTDGAVAFDTGIGQAGGMAYRLYQAAFDRAPDAAGLGYWLAQMDKGTALGDVAAAFVASTEFATRVGGAGIGNTEFATALYRNVLHRAPDAAGLDYWVGVLKDGTARGDVLASFGESPENVAQLVGIANGFWYQPYSA